MRLKALAVALCLPLYAGCATSAPSADHFEKNQDRFRKHLIERRVEDASRFLLVLEADQRTSPELMAQFHLLNCQPTSAQKQIDRIRDENTRAMFQAVLLALVSVEKPALPGERKATLSAKSKLEKYSNTDGEIWADEWADLRFASAGCTQMPRIESLPERMLALERSKRLFENLPFQEYSRDFDLVALAMDTGAAIPNVPELLALLPEQSSHPYYRRLMGGIPEDRKPSQQVKIAATGEMEIQLTELQLQTVELKPKQSLIPMLIGQNP